MPPIVVSVALLFEPILGTVIGYFLLGELEVGHWTLLGGALMIAGAWILSSWLERESIQQDTGSSGD